MKTQFTVYRCTKLWKDLSFDNNYNFLVFRFTRSKFSKVFLRYHIFFVYLQGSARRGNHEYPEKLATLGTQHTIKIGKTGPIQGFTLVIAKGM